MNLRITLLLGVTFLWLLSFGQPQGLMPIDTTQKSVEHWQKWLTDLNELGVEKKNDSFFVKQEVLLLLRDSDYRISVYPGAYSWQRVTELMNTMELKKAFWHLINLYQTDTSRRNMVVGTFVLYDSLMDMDKILVSTFYTYAFTDPQVCRIINGKPDIYRPDLLEKKLRTTREIINYIWMNRKNKQNGSKK